MTWRRQAGLGKPAAEELSRGGRVEEHGQKKWSGPSFHIPSQCATCSNVFPECLEAVVLDVTLLTRCTCKTHHLQCAVAEHRYFCFLPNLSLWSLREKQVSMETQILEGQVAAAINFMARVKNLDTGELAGFLSPSGAKERKTHMELPTASPIGYPVLGQLWLGSAERDNNNGLTMLKVYFWQKIPEVGSQNSGSSAPWHHPTCCSSSPELCPQSSWSRTESITPVFQAVGWRGVQKKWGKECSSVSSWKSFWKFSHDTFAFIPLVTGPHLTRKTWKCKQQLLL